MAFLVIGMPSHFGTAPHSLRSPRQAWKNFAARNAFRASHGHSTITEQLEPARAGPVDTLHVHAHGDHALSALGEPVTELAVCKLREGARSRPLHAKSRVDAIVDSILGASEGIHPPSTYVKTVDIPKVWYIAVGWDTRQVCPSGAVYDRGTHFMCF